ncbi:GDP-mannose 4,6-dehydratase, partial [Klebsiella pneumoniae]|uniref:GDP-mannose 4,6-dehydratase n=1 Tax=Klebsiella pneumoniae TaxID=573 RepID=UPI0025A20ED7
VVDLANGHVCALQAIDRKCGLAIYNLGTGKGYSVLDVVKSFEKVNGVKIPYQIQPRRSGDIDEYYSDPSKVYRELGWEAKFTLDDM